MVYKDDDSRRLRMPQILVGEAIRAMEPALALGGATAGAAGQDLVLTPGDEVVLSVTVSEGTPEYAGACRRIPPTARG